MSLLLKHAKRELALLGYLPPETLEADDPNKAVQEDIIELIETFSKQGHSSMSASYVIGMFFKLANFDCLRPLTGEDCEWEKVDFQTLQNVRCNRVFKNINTGRVFDVQGKVFQTPDGARFTNAESSVDVVFPYAPITEVVNIELPEEPSIQ